MLNATTHYIGGFQLRSIIQFVLTCFDMYVSADNASYGTSQSAPVDRHVNVKTVSLVGKRGKPQRSIGKQHSQFWYLNTEVLIANQLREHNHIIVLMCSYIIQFLLLFSMLASSKNIQDSLSFETELNYFVSDTYFFFHGCCRMKGQFSGAVVILT